MTTEKATTQEQKERKRRARSFAQEMELDKLTDFVCEILKGNKAIFVGTDYAVISKKVYQDFIAEQKPLPHSNRGGEWLNFYPLVARHIEDYTVPQYGDKPTDPLSLDWSIEDCAKGIKKYCDRAGKNSRGQAENLRDMLKIAHYACVAYFKMVEGDK